MKIVLIDDEATVRGIVAEMLELDDHEVLQASSGPEGLDLLAAHGDVELVLTDVGMPHMNGWDVARAVKERYPGTRVGLITGYGEMNADASMRAAADFIIGKPVTEESLRAVRPS